jgi:outer membrane protein assembly factor BamB
MRNSCSSVVVWLTGISILASAGHAAKTDAEWPSWRGPHRDGKSPDVGLLKEWPEDGPRLLWKVDNLGRGFSNVAVAGGTVYTTGDVDDRLVLFALDLDGNLKWSSAVDEAWTRNHPGSRSTPTIDDGNLYLLSGHGLIGCYDAATGQPKWTRRTREFGGRSGGWGYAESVLIYKNLAICKPGGENCVVALDKTTGETVWTSSGFQAGPEYSSCLLVEYEDQSILVTGTRSGIVCVDAADGTLLWSNDWSANNTANCPTPAYSDGYVFWANGYGKGGICMKLKRENGKVGADVAWTTTDIICHHGGYVILDGYIYGNHGGGWSCLDLKTGEVMWNQRAVGKGSLCYADGMLYLFGERGGRGALATCSPEGMEVKGSVQVDGDGPSWAHPVVVGGRLYLRYANNLYCFDVNTNATDSP